MNCKQLDLAVESSVTALQSQKNTDLLGQEAVESECKPLDQEDDDDGDLHEGQEDVGDHDDVDAEEGELPDVGHEVDPRRRDRDGAQLPLPAVPRVVSE